MKPTPQGRPALARRGFTLVELLTVIVIIGILAGLITVAAQSAIKAAHRMTITGEISQLSMALQKYKNHNGDFPPDFCGVNDPDPLINGPARNAVLQHVRRVFPQCRFGERSGNADPDPWVRFRADVLVSCGVDVNNLDPASGLVFWLGGPPARDGSAKLAGFSANPRFPFQIDEKDTDKDGTPDTSADDLDGDGVTDHGGSRLDPSFEFDETRLALVNDLYRYVPPSVKSPDGADGVENIAPYVYFRARQNGYLRLSSMGRGDREDTSKNDPPYQPYFFMTADAGMCFPCAKSHQDDGNVRIYEWFAPKKFQIASPGLDGLYSAVPVPTGALASSITQAEVRVLDEAQKNLTREEDDNLTSFTKGQLDDWSEGK